MSRGATVADPIRELWLEYVMPTLHSFANILRAHDRIMIVRSLQVSLEFFRDEIVNFIHLFQLPGDLCGNPCVQPFNN
jgi:hypothetical protein